MVSGESVPNPNDATRIESDSMGEVRIPRDALYGPQTQRAVENFPISGQSMPEQFVRALLAIKAAAAHANGELKCLDAEAAAVIEVAVGRLLADEALMAHFPVDVYQTGSGTSSNMNANEVIARSAELASGIEIHPNDHVNYGQSSNDVIPSAIHVSAVLVGTGQLLPALEQLMAVIDKKAESLRSVTKTGRTHLMDAMPVRFDQSLHSWLAQLEDCHRRITEALDDLRCLAIGGTAVGTGVNTHRDFGVRLTAALSRATGQRFTAAESPFHLMSSQDGVVALSGQLRVLAVALTKVANDLRWMNSGPLAGMGEIALPSLQPGSSIMPGKVNPVIPEAAAMVCARIIGNDVTITMAGQSGNFELNVMLPVIAQVSLESMELLSGAMRTLASKAVAGFTVNTPRVAESLSRNPILVTALNPIIGYGKAASIAKKAYESGRPIIDVAEEETGMARSELEKLLDPQRLTGG